LIKHSLNGSLKVVGDEILNGRSPHNFFGTAPNQSACALVPHINAAKSINSKYGSVGSVYQTGVLALLGQTSGDILSDAHHANDVALLVASGGGIEENLETRARLCHEQELEVGCLLSPATPDRALPARPP
jgi:hypothetical protein